MSLVTAYSTGDGILSLDVNAKGVTAPSIIGFGDSITVGVGSTGNNTGYTTRLATLSGKSVINEGISGTTVQESGISRYNTVFHTSPNYNRACVIYYGTNDIMRCGFDPFSGNYLACLDEIVASLIATGDYWNKRIVLCTTGFIEESFLLDPARSASYQCGTLARQTKINQDIKKIAYRYNTLFVDLFAIMSSQASPSSLLADGLHPNDTGHQLIANSIYSVLQPYL